MSGTEPMSGTGPLSGLKPPDCSVRRFGSRDYDHYFPSAASHNSHVPVQFVFLGTLKRKPDRSVVFNNAAVSIVLSDTGNECFALELFLGALESKLSYECTQLPVDSLETEQDERESSLHHLGVRPSRPGCVLRAETLFQNLETCLQPRPTCAEEVQQDNGGIDSAITVPQHCRGYDPYIYKTPMSIPDHLVSTHFTSSAIVYNLALIHQMFNRESQAAAQFYEISATLLIGSGTDDQTPESSLLRMALLNNFGVWCFENSDGEVMRTCMEEMAIAMDDPSQKRIQLEENVRQGFRENIRWLLTPLNGGSPAA